MNEETFSRRQREFAERIEILRAMMPDDGCTEILFDGSTDDWRMRCEAIAFSPFDQDTKRELLDRAYVDYVEKLEDIVSEFQET